MIHLKTQNCCKNIQNYSWKLRLTPMGLVSYSTTSSLHDIMWFLHSIRCPFHCAIFWLLSWVIQYPDLPISLHNPLNLQFFLAFMGNISSYITPHSVQILLDCAFLRYPLFGFELPHLLIVIRRSHIILCFGLTVISSCIFVVAYHHFCCPYAPKLSFPIIF